MRFQGIVGDPETSKSENLGPTTEQVRKVLKEIGVTAQITELKKIGKFDKNQTKSRPLFVTFPNYYNARLALATPHENRIQLAEELFPALSKEDSVREDMCLRKAENL